MTTPATRPSRRTLLLLPGVAALTALTACSSEPTRSTSMTVYKDASCGCCSGWVTHVQDHGFAVTTQDVTNLADVWQEHDIALDLQSCHLAVTSDEHLFVGHVPVRHVREYLADPPKGARGLSVPAMPVGTPGMEQGDQLDPYSVMLLTAGTPRVFAEVRTHADQEV